MANTTSQLASGQTQGSIYISHIIDTEWRGKPLNNYMANVKCMHHNKRPCTIGVTVTSNQASKSRCDYLTCSTCPATCFKLLAVYSKLCASCIGQIYMYVYITTVHEVCAVLLCFELWPLLQTYRHEWRASNLIVIYLYQLCLSHEKQVNSHMKKMVIIHVGHTIADLTAGMEEAHA